MHSDTPSYWLQISAGQGPAECAWVVAQLAERLQREAAAAGLSAQVLEAEAGLRPQTLKSVLLSLEGPHAARWSQTWRGTVQWVGESPFRPRHRRKNWFVGVTVFAPPETPLWRLEDLRFENLRASGPGGQNVNKVESAVRITHLPSGLSVLAREERSQWRNRQLGLARLQSLLAAQGAAAQQQAEQSRWQAHHSLERGNPVRVFKGPQFQPGDA
ncbi:MAG: peptide chain release factor H [Candidatus Sericytochromatia bacterium]